MMIEKQMNIYKRNSFFFQITHDQIVLKISNIVDFDIY